MLRSPLIALLLLGCSGARYSSEPGAPTLVLPARFAEGSEPAAAASASASSSAPSAPPAGPPPMVSPATVSQAPDPTPLVQAEQVAYELELAEGKIRVVSATPVVLAKPVSTPRRLGRYALELSIGNELIERVRFDFPGTAADEPVPGPKKLSAPMGMTSRAVAKVKVLVPHSPRVRRAVLVDRALETTQELPWPLPAAPAAVPGSAP